VQLARDIERPRDVSGRCVGAEASAQVTCAPRQKEDRGLAHVCHGCETACIAPPQSPRGTAQAAACSAESLRVPKSPDLATQASAITGT
jgi:hypothetical protein